MYYSAVPNVYYKIGIKQNTSTIYMQFILINCTTDYQQLFSLLGTKLKDSMFIL